MYDKRNEIFVDSEGRVPNYFPDLSDLDTFSFRFSFSHNEQNWLLLEP